MDGVGNKDNDFLCSVCALDFLTSHEFSKHLETSEHRINWLNRQYRTNRLRYLQDKHGLMIDVSSENSKIIYKPDAYTVEVITGNPHQDCNSVTSTEDDKDKEPLSFTLTLFHDGTKSFYLSSVALLNRIRLIDSDTEFHIEDKFQISKREKLILFRPTKRYKVDCTIVPGAIARALHIPILFEFLPVVDSLIEGNEESVQPFYIGKTIEIKGASYSVRDFGKYIPGVFPVTRYTNALERELKLGLYNIPPWFESLAFNNDPVQIRKRMNIKETLTSKTHVDFFRTLLWLEELQEELDIQFYSKKDVTLNFSNYLNVNQIKCVELVEKGLGENRPCVMVKDRVFVCCTKEATQWEYPQWYEGFVHRVNNTSIFIGFNQSEFLPRYDNTTKFNVEFVINRYTLRVRHRAIDLCERDSLYGFLFPPNYDKSPQIDLPQITPYDFNISKNTEQIQAIQHIVAGSSGSAPYVIFGPPGTGKTVTVVEAIKQVLYRVDRSYVLACAPSNTAADVLTERLLEHFTETHVFRIYAESRVRYLEKLPPKLREASNYCEQEKNVRFPCKAELMKKRVLVCTFITAAKLAAACFPKGHFTHVFLDEVGHAMECEALVGVTGILPAWGHLILAGDPHQLGPVVRNMQAMSGGRIFPKIGLDTSLLERIMAMPLYTKKSGQYNPKYVTKLVKNYRSHHTILSVPNELFYNSELQANGSPSLVDYLTNWPHLPRRGFPMIFHSVIGEDKMERHSPSYHNLQELQEVISYLKKLLNGEPKVHAEEIGIITPYRLQVEKLRRAVERDFRNEFQKLKIGSVEDFQGEERKVIIISTVRATNRHIAKDQLFRLGFLRNPKRFNVAVTRAQCLVILVGCAKVLMLDSNWKRLITYITQNGGLAGVPIQPPQDNIEDLLNRMDNLSIRPTVGNMSQRQVVEVPAWQRN